jgi:hypothetical protein
MWAEGLCYNKGLFSEVLVYHDDEPLYLEVRGKESGVVRFSFEMLQALGEIVVEDELEGQPRRMASLACGNFILAGFVDKALSPGPSKGKNNAITFTWGGPPGRSSHKKVAKSGRWLTGERHREQG